MHGCYCVAHAAEDVDDGVVLQHEFVAAHQVKQRARLQGKGKATRTARVGMSALLALYVTTPAVKAAISVAVWKVPLRRTSVHAKHQHL